MLTELCSITNNYFCGHNDMHPGTYNISGGNIELPFLIEGQYFRIVGSVMNDGVYQYPAAGLTDETFTGSIWAMSVPPAFLQLAEDVQAYNATDAAKPSPYASESFGGYSYSRFTDGHGRAATDWRIVFRERLREWRKL